MSFSESLRRGTVSLALAILGGIIAMTSGWYALKQAVSEANAAINHHIEQPMHPIAGDRMKELDRTLGEIKSEQRVQGTDIEYIKRGIQDIQRQMENRRHQ